MSVLESGGVDDDDSSGVFVVGDVGCWLMYLLSRRRIEVLKVTIVREEDLGDGVLLPSGSALSDEDRVVVVSAAVSDAVIARGDSSSQRTRRSD